MQIPSGTVDAEAAGVGTTASWLGKVTVGSGDGVALHAPRAIHVARASLSLFTSTPESVVFE